MIKTLRGRVAFTYLVVVVISLVLASVFFLFFLSRYIKDRDRAELLREVAGIAKDIAKLPQSLLPPERDGVQPTAPTPPGTQPVEPVGKPDLGVVRLLEAEARLLETKLILVRPDGYVVAESGGRPVLNSRTVELPEGIFNESGPQIRERVFPKLGKTYLWATAPTRIGNQAGFVIATKPAEEVSSVAPALIGYVAVAGAIALAISMLFALYLSGAISRPIREVTEAARRMAAGDYSAEVPVRGSDETAELARDFNAMAARVRTAYELQRNFVGNVSHELRTPLTSIEGFSQALLDGVSTSEEEQRRSLEIINQESKRLVRVLRDLLLLSQIDAGELRPEMRQTDLTDLVRRLESIYGARAEESGLALRVEAPPQPVTLFTDPDRLERILTNLLDNAFKYTGEGGTVALSAVVSEASVRISVADTGAGIPPEVLPNIFDRFYRVEKSRSKKTGGSGLGLSISKELVWSLGGTINVQSLLGHGTTFTVTLPIS